MKKILILMYIFIFSIYAVPFGENEAEKTTDSSITVPANETKTLRIAFAGDIMCHKWQLRGAYDDKIGKYDFNNSFSEIGKYIEDSDVAIANFETTLAGDKKKYRYYPTFNSPDSFADAVKNMGIDIVTTANNHSLDSGTAGIKRTLDILDKAGLEHTGTFRTEEESNNVFYKEVNGITFSILNYTYGTNGISLPTSSAFMVNYIDKEKIKNDLNKAKEINPDIIIVYVHFGAEYETFPNDKQRETAMFLKENGADMVIGSHPHVVQPFEMDKENGKETFIVYSLGNFISSQRTLPRDAGVIAYVNVSKTGDEKIQIDEVSFVPTWVHAKRKGEEKYNMTVLPAGITSFSSIELREEDKARMTAIENEMPGHITGVVNIEKNMKNEYVFYERKPLNLVDLKARDKETTSSAVTIHGSLQNQVIF